MSKVLDLTQDRVIIGDGTNILFDTENTFIVKDETLPTDTNKLFTKVLNLNTKQIIPENNSIENLQRPYKVEDWGDPSLIGRDSIPAGPSISRPFLEFYTYNGSAETRFYCFLLLVDISPVRQGFYEFFIGDNRFYGFVRKLTKYDHYNWQISSDGKYSWIKQNTPLGYGIEIYPGDLFYNYESQDPTGANQTVSLVGEKPLLSFLRTLTGGEEIISNVSAVNPDTFNQPVKNLPIGLTNDQTGLVYSYSEGYDLLKLSPTDALCYIASYPSLINSFKNLNTSQLISAGQNDWAENAISLGRKITFNPLAYINKYSDIKQTYSIGSNIDFLGATEHYIKTGFSEGRNLTGSSTTYTNSRAGLYDERSTSIDLPDNVIIFPIGQTIAGKGKILTYKFNNEAYFLNGNLPVDEKTIFLRTL